MKATSRKALLAVVLGLAAVGVSVLVAFGVLELFEPIFCYEWKQERMVRRVMASNPEQVLSAARELLRSRPGFTGHLKPSALHVPRALRKLSPTEIWFFTNAVSVDFSDVLNPFGITAYAVEAKPPPPPQYGVEPRQWIEGLWVYDDGQLERFGQQVGAANRSQPVRPETNQQSVGAGSAR
jgi:hypothetical protein